MREFDAFLEPGRGDVLGAFCKCLKSPPSLGPRTSLERKYRFVSLYECARSEVWHIRPEPHQGWWPSPIVFDRNVARWMCTERHIRGCTVDKGRARHFMLALNSSVAMDGHRHDREHKVLAESSISVVLRGSVLSTEGANVKAKRKVLRFSS